MSDLEKYKFDRLTNLVDRGWRTITSYHYSEVDLEVKNIRNILPNAKVNPVDYYGRHKENLAWEDIVPYWQIHIEFDNEADEAEFIMRMSN